jgi:hypothetical protein
VAVRRVLGKEPLTSEPLVKIFFFSFLPGSVRGVVSHARAAASVESVTDRERAGIESERVQGARGVHIECHVNARRLCFVLAIYI